MSRLTLTFDNGPSETTPAVLGELARRRLPAIFFVVGNQLQRPGATDVVIQAAADGHRIGNHTMSHDIPLGLLDDDRHIAEEIAATQDLLDEMGVVADPPLFRPFGLGGKLGRHLLSPGSARHLEAEGYTIALWNSVPVDWEPPFDAWVGRAMADLAENDHTVLVLHDLPSGAMDHLPAFLDQVGERDIEVTLDLPAECTPMVAGRPGPALADCVATAGSG